MQFSEDTVRLAWAWAARRCTCKRDGHGHPDRCERDIVWRRRGVRGSGGWDARHRVPPAEGGKDEPENCEILCWACYQSLGAQLQPDRRGAEGDRSELAAPGV
jgi:hypothetical protein